MNETDKEYIKSQGFTDEDIADPTFIEAISRGAKPILTLTGEQFLECVRKIAYGYNLNGDVFQIRQEDIPEYINIYE